MGRAAHCLILEGRNAFDREYVVTDGPINPRTGESYGRNTKTFAEWAATQEREIISGKDFSFFLKLQRGSGCTRSRRNCWRTASRKVWFGQSIVPFPARSGWIGSA